MRPRNFHSQVIWALGTAIVQGDYPEGGILPGDTELTEQFGVSRTVLREALKTLSAKGLIEARARVGTRVLPRARWNMFDPDLLAWHLETGLDINFVHHLAEVRMAVEPEAAALAAERRSGEHVEALMSWLGQMERTGQSAEEFAQNDLEFHKVVADASGNPFMVSLSAVVEVALTAAFKVSSPVEGGEAFDRAVGLHRDIAEAIADRRPDDAREAMRHAIRSGVDRASQALGVS
ncbi:FadR/GntR family transcriptional regulator [Pelagibacterium xiamenense]|uniref:FadR/GntR family transcriptional regulator n=1 Tax=Pelagibacterium xiamenense TaxID=2901140 RepID=UPI001E5180D6|nr:FadR/GntR family transcriptional regulator [Pelagibacterium xiamenense]MCD7058945.1 FadR family transcriptional regulator [Pelagibacterium xiamenense]